MCVIFFYANSNPSSGYKLILASNRDEFYARNTRGASKWINAPHCYGGVDLEPGREGGTWLGVSGNNGVFKIGALLNLTGEPKLKNAHGRGMIVSDFVTSTSDDEIGESTKPAQITLCSNVPPGLTHYEEGKCYGFGNSLPTNPFEKVCYGQKRFEEIVQNFLTNQERIISDQAQNNLVNDLLTLLKCKKKFWPDAELLRRAPNWGESLSALNVHIPDASYGSRTHSVILIDSNDKMHFIEDTMAGMDHDGEWIHTHIEKQY